MADDCATRDRVLVFGEEAVKWQGKQLSIFSKWLRLCGAQCRAGQQSKERIGLPHVQRKPVSLNGGLIITAAGILFRLCGSVFPEGFKPRERQRRHRKPREQLECNAGENNAGNVERQHRDKPSQPLTIKFQPRKQKRSHSRILQSRRPWASAFCGF